MSDPGLDQQLDEYAAWIHQLRTAHSATPPAPVAGTVLGKLGHELELLAETLARRERELLSLFDVVSAVGKGVRVEEVLTRIFDGFRGLIPYDRIGCAFLRDNGRVLESFWAKSLLGPIVLGIGYRRAIVGSSLEPILQTRQPRILNDLAAYLAQKPGSDSTRRIVAEGGRSSLTCPLVVDDVPLGFLFFTSREPNAYSASHQVLFRQIAAQVSMVIHKSQAYEELLVRNQSLIAETHRLEVVATTDPLTGLLNRRAIDAVLARAGDRLEREGRMCGVVMADIDHFKQVNDTHGHEVGDRVLQVVADRLRSAMRDSDVVGRVGGEEFLVVVDRCADRDELAMVGERLRLAVETERPDDHLPLAVSASFGCALANRETPPAHAVAAADLALYAAKRGGRNRVVSA